MYLVYNTLYNLPNADRQADCFRNVARVLEPDGAFVLECFVLDPAQYDRGQRVEALSVEEDSVVLQVSRHDAAAQRLFKQHLVFDADGFRGFPVALRYCWPSELDLMARLAGLELAERYAGWDRSPFGRGARATSRCTGRAAGAEACSSRLEQDLQLFAMLVALGGLLALAPTLRLPVPILLVFGGVALGFVPGLPHVVLAPDVVLVAVLPPLLYSGAFFTSLRDLRTNRRPIAFLAFGLVAATMAIVAVVAHEWIGLLVGRGVHARARSSRRPTRSRRRRSPSRLGAPRRIVSLIEGESLVNDGTALVLYRAAVGAAIGGTFSLLDTSAQIVVDVAGGIAVGLAVGWVVRQVRRRLDDPPIEVAIAVLSGYLAYLPAVAIGVSGVLAAVTIGVYMGWHTPGAHERAHPPDRRRLLGDPRVPGECAPVRAGRASSYGASSTRSRAPPPRRSSATRCSSARR